MMRNVIAFLLMWLGLILQSTVFQISPFNAIQPGFVLVILIVVALVRGPRVALILGVMIGFIQDADYGAFLGLNAFAYGVVGYFSGVVFGQFLHRNIAITFVATVVATFIQDTITFSMTRLFDVTAYSWRMMFQFTLQQMILNGVILLLTYSFLSKVLANRQKRKYKHDGAEKA